MKAFRTLLKTESKLIIRHMDSVFFGILFPVGMTMLLGVIYRGKPAFEGANYSFLQQSFGALVSVGICATGLMGLPLTIADYRNKKILKRFKVTPVSPGMLLLVQIVICFTIAVLSGIAVFGTAALFFGYRFTGSIGAFTLSYLLVTAAIYGLGMLLASIAPNIKVANLLCTLIYFPMIFLSGATVPYEIMPETMQKVVNVLPLTHGIKLLKGYSLGTEGDGFILPLCLMGGLGLICILLSIKLFKWE